MFFTNFDFGMLSLAVLGMHGMEKNEGLINISGFSKIDIRVGTVIKSELFPEAKKPAYKLIIDFGELGQRKTSAQITKFYHVDELEGKQVVAVLNLPIKQIANLMSECLLLGAVDNDNQVTLLVPDVPVKDGLRIA